jgi:hypothetical protein
MDLPQGYEIHELPADYTGKVWIEGQVRQYGDICKATPDALSQAIRLALELECLLLDCNDTAAVSKWCGSAHDALEQWREFCRSELAFI